MTKKLLYTIKDTKSTVSQRKNYKNLVYEITFPEQYFAL